MLNLRSADTNTIPASTARVEAPLPSAMPRPKTRELSRTAVSDKQLALAVRAGDHRALAELFRRYQWLVRRMSYRYRFPGGDAADVEQVAQIALWDAAVHAFQPDRGASFRTFVEMHVNHRVLRGLRAATARKHAALNLAQSLDEPPSAARASLRDPDDATTLGDYLTDGVDLYDEIERLEASAAMRMALSRAERALSEREALALRAVASGISLAGAARKAGVTPQTMQKAAASGRRKVQAALSAATRAA